MKIYFKILKMTVLIMVFIFCVFHYSGFAENIPFDSPRWVIPPDTAHLEDYLGKKSLYLKGGIAYVKDADFTNGIITFSLAFSATRGFFGGVFRMQDKDNYEEFYLRSHQSGNPDALQYTPVYNGMAAWQLYHGEGFSAVSSFTFDKWMHVKLVVSGKYAELYIDNDDQPVLFMHHLKREIKPGFVGIKVLPFSAGHFADFTITKTDNPPLKGKAKLPQTIEAGTITAWSISSPFPEHTLKDKSFLTGEDDKTLKWKKLVSEGSGLANISKVEKLVPPNNTVYARIIIQSEKQQVKTLHFGFSDRVKVYLNGGLLYSGTNNYRSRDYRFLGTIGYFDQLVLPLKKGTNELRLAVSESFGGWGIKGRFDDLKEITLKAH